MSRSRVARGAVLLLPPLIILLLAPNPFKIGQAAESRGDRRRCAVEANALTDADLAFCTCVPAHRRRECEKLRLDAQMQRLALCGY